MLLKHLLLELFGKKFTLTISSQDGSEAKKIPALVSKNTKVDERPYRITWFNDQLVPYKHYDLDDEELKTLIDKHTLPTRIGDKILSYMYKNREIPTTGDISQKLIKIEPDSGPIV